MIEACRRASQRSRVPGGTPAPRTLLALLGHVSAEGVASAARLGQEGGTWPLSGLTGPAAWGLGSHGHPGAGPMATAEARRIRGRSRGRAVSPRGPGLAKGKAESLGERPAGLATPGARSGGAGRRPGAQGGRRAPAWAERGGVAWSGEPLLRPRLRRDAGLGWEGVRARPLGQSAVGGAWRGGPPPQTAPALRCGPGRALCARVGGAQWRGLRGAGRPQTAPAQMQTRAPRGPETQGWLHAYGCCGGLGGSVSKVKGPSRLRAQLFLSQTATCRRWAGCGMGARPADTPVVCCEKAG